MNEPAPPNNEGRNFKPLPDVEICWDGPGDTTVRPIPPYLLEHARAERTKIYGSPEPRAEPIPPEVLAIISNCVDVWFEGEEDTTVRPITDPKRLEHIKAEWAKIVRWSEPISPPTDSKENT